MLTSIHRHHEAGLIASMLCAALLLLLAAPAQAGWRFDAGRWRASVHGEFACADCHEDVLDAARHPDPAAVDSRPAKDAKTELCLSCHPDVQDEIEANNHAGRPVDEPAALAYCVDCHDPHTQGAPDDAPAAELSQLPEEDAACLACHALPMGDEQAVAAGTRAFCLSCHGASAMPDLPAPLIDENAYASTPHAGMDCLSCHPGAASFPHTEQGGAGCVRCHERHDEADIHDPHFVVACESCHLNGVAPRRDPETRTILWTSPARKAEISPLHDMKHLEDEESCRRCHAPGNAVGAAGMVLPPKSLMCMPCHAATFGVQDGVSALSLGVFLVGLGLTLALWLTASMPGKGGFAAKLASLAGGALRALFSSRVKPIAGALVFDVLLQRRLWRRSRQRWLFHSLIFLPFVLRFLWGLAALVLTTWFKDLSLGWVLVDKNAPATAFVYDLTGLMILVGVVLAWLRGREADKTRLPGLPGQDRAALGLIAGVVAVGFLLEGMRVAMTGHPAGSSWAFLGAALAALFGKGAGLTDLYGYAWYLHAIVTGVFVAYLPFSRMLHILLAPVVLAMNAVSAHEHGRHDRQD